MKDFNFFSPYTNANKTSKKSIIYVLVTILVIALGIAGAEGFIYFKTKNLEKEIASYEEYLNSKSLPKKLESVKDKRRKIEILNKYYDSVKKINITVDDEDKINSRLIESIASTLPQSIYFVSMNMSTDSIDIEGGSMDRVAIAELQYNLKELGVFESVHVSNIDSSVNQEDDGEDFAFNFDIKCTFEGGKDNETD